MIRNLLASTAIATLVATGAAYAQTAPAPAPAPMEQPAVPQVKHAEGHLASNIIGETVYSSAGEEGESIGSVNDLVISPEGNVEAIVVGVGGFLGIGQKNVALEYALVEWHERDGNEWLVLPTNREALDALPEFDTSAYRHMAADAEVGNTTPATAQELGVAAPATQDTTAAPAGTTAPVDSQAAAPADANQDADATMATEEHAAPADETLADNTLDGAATEDEVAQAPTGPVVGTDDTQTSAIDRSTLSDVSTDTLSADEFIGTTVYGTNDENVGSISDVILTDGEVDAVIIDVGGFLGIGSKSVAVDLDNLAFLSDGDGNYYLYTPFTQEQLEAHPEYDEASFAERRDDQLIIVPAQ